MPYVSCNWLVDWLTDWWWLLYSSIVQFYCEDNEKTKKMKKRRKGFTVSMCKCVVSCNRWVDWRSLLHNAIVHCFLLLLFFVVVVVVVVVVNAKKTTATTKNKKEFTASIGRWVCPATDWLIGALYYITLLLNFIVSRKKTTTTCVYSSLFKIFSHKSY